MLFDRIAVFNSDNKWAGTDERIAELEWLQERGLLVTHPFLDLRDLLTRDDLSALWKETREALLRPGLGNNPVNRSLDEEVHTAFAARMLAVKMREAGSDAVPILSSSRLPAGGHYEVVTVVLQNLPLPDDMTEWEQVLEFRRDDRVRQHHAKLRTWINHAALGALTAHELAGEVESAVQNFDSYMRQYRIGRTLGTIEAVIKAGAVGAIAGIGLDQEAAVVGAVGSIAVSLMRRRTELLRAEMDAPGAELAFISKAREAFGGAR